MIQCIVAWWSIRGSFPFVLLAIWLVPSFRACLVTVITAFCMLHFLFFFLMKNVPMARSRKKKEFVDFARENKDYTVYCPGPTNGQPLYHSVFLFVSLQSLHSFSFIRKRMQLQSVSDCQSLVSILRVYRKCVSGPGGL